MTTDLTVPAVQDALERLVTQLDHAALAARRLAESRFDQRGWHDTYERFYTGLTRGAGAAA